MDTHITEHEELNQTNQKVSKAFSRIENENDGVLR
jgi:hypothetical protein